MPQGAEHLYDGYLGFAPGAVTNQDMRKRKRSVKMRPPPLPVAAKDLGHAGFDAKVLEGTGLSVHNGNIVNRRGVNVNQATINRVVNRAIERRKIAGMREEGRASFDKAGLNAVPVTMRRMKVYNQASDYGANPAAGRAAVEKLLARQVENAQATHTLAVDQRDRLIHQMGARLGRQEMANLTGPEGRVRDLRQRLQSDDVRQRLYARSELKRMGYNFDRPRGTSVSATRAPYERKLDTSGFQRAADMRASLERLQRARALNPYGTVSRHETAAAAALDAVRNSESVRQAERAELAEKYGDFDNNTGPTHITPGPPPPPPPSAEDTAMANDLSAAVRSATAQDPSAGLPGFSEPTIGTTPAPRSPSGRTFKEYVDDEAGPQTESRESRRRFGRIARYFLKPASGRSEFVRKTQDRLQEWISSGNSDAKEVLRQARENQDADVEAEMRRMRADGWKPRFDPLEKDPDVQLRKQAVRNVLDRDTHPFLLLGRGEDRGVKWRYFTDLIEFDADGNPRRKKGTQRPPGKNPPGYNDRGEIDIAGDITFDVPGLAGPAEATAPPPPDATAAATPANAAATPSNLFEEDPIGTPPANVTNLFEEDALPAAPQRTASAPAPASTESAEPPSVELNAEQRAAAARFRWQTAMAARMEAKHRELAEAAATRAITPEEHRTLLEIEEKKADIERVKALTKDIADRLKLDQQNLDHELNKFKEIMRHNQATEGQTDEANRRLAQQSQAEIQSAMARMVKTAHEIYALRQETARAPHLHQLEAVQSLTRQVTDLYGKMTAGDFPVADQDQIDQVFELLREIHKFQMGSDIVNAGPRARAAAGGVGGAPTAAPGPPSSE